MLAANPRPHMEAEGSGSEHTRTLDVADDGTSSIVHELNANLSDTTTGA